MKLTKPTPELTYWYIHNDKVYRGYVGRVMLRNGDEPNLEWGEDVVAYSTKREAQRALRKQRGGFKWLKITK